MRIDRSVAASNVRGCRIQARMAVKLAILKQTILRSLAVERGARGAIIKISLISPSLISYLLISQRLISLGLTSSGLKNVALSGAG